MEKLQKEKKKKNSPGLKAKIVAKKNKSDNII